MVVSNAFDKNQMNNGGEELNRNAFGVVSLFSSYECACHFVCVYVSMSIRRSSIPKGNNKFRVEFYVYVDVLVHMNA